MNLQRVYVEYLELLSRDWSSVRAAGLLSPEVIAYVQPRFHRCSSPLKVRIILSIIYLPEAVRVAAREPLIGLLAEAEVDKDEWVRKLGRLISSFVATGSLDVRDTDSETAFQILKHVNANQKIQHKPPLDISDMVNVICEPLFAPTADEDLYATGDFAPGLDINAMVADLRQRIRAASAAAAPSYS